MKKIILICTILLLIGCVLIFYYTLISSNSGGNLVPNRKVAAAMAKEIYFSMDKSEEIQNFILEDVTYDASNETWVVSFWADPSKPGPVSTGKLYISIRKSDAAVLEIYHGERFEQIELVQ